MTIRTFREKTPSIAETAYIDESAVVIGDVKVGADSSVWPMVVIRGDDQAVVIGERSNIQDGSVLHVTHEGPLAPDGFSLNIGSEVTVGHKVVLHACTVEDKCLIGMGSVVLDGAVICSGCILGAGSVVSPGKVLEGGYLYLGAPARKIRELNQKEKDFLSYSAKHYVRLKNDYMHCD